MIDTVAAAQDRLDGVFLYVSDHGESTGEHGYYLHGAPALIAPEEQTRVPMLLWMAPEYLARRLRRRAAWPTDLARRRVPAGARPARPAHRGLRCESRPDRRLRPATLSQGLRPGRCAAMLAARMAEGPWTSCLLKRSGSIP